jgi:subtilisin family serine protease
MEGENMKFIAALAVLGAMSSAQAAKIAVIDSGLDYKHEMIVPNLWTNSNEIADNRDEDGNGYQDDVNGWNFAEQNGMIIDYKYLGTFSADCKTYFDIQGKYFLGQATEADIAWIKAKQKDPAFLKEMGKFGNFVHGTHVAGITIRDSKNEAMGIKLIPTEVKPFFAGLSDHKSADPEKKWKLLETAFTALAAQQMTLLTNIATFAAFHKVDVANGSFGTGFKQGKMIGDLAFRAIFFKKPTEEESNRAASLFIGALVKEGSKFVAAAPNVLFVFAAGNDGMSNDEFGTSPANIKADNVITVGATYKNEFFAPFSNFGTKMVDIAAPGMLVESAIPGNDYLKVSGTSQAAPYVANVAAKIKEANVKLTPLEVKKILMGTVDRKGFLTEKVTTGGIVNIDRAVMAAQMTNTMSINDAIARSEAQVRDMPVAPKSEVNANAVVPMPLYPMFR